MLAKCLEQCLAHGKCLLSGKQTIEILSSAAENEDVYYARPSEEKNNWGKSKGDGFLKKHSGPSLDRLSAVC